MWVKGSTWEGTRYLFDVESGRFAFAWSSDGYAGQIGFYQTAWGLFGATPSLDVWHHIALCCGADARLYVDGVPYGSTKTYTGVVFGGAAALGSRNTTYLYSFAGLLDEVRVSSVLRSPDWVAASYSNMVPDSAFIAYNPVMPTPGPSLQIVSRPPGYGVANPVYGVHEGLEEGHTYTCSVSRVWDDADGYRYRCTGWKRYDIDRVTFEESPLGEEATNELVYTHGDLERLEWYFAPQSVRLTTSASAGGSVEVSPASDDGYYAIGAIVTNTATPAEGYTFAYWSDDVPAGVTATDPTITFAVDKPRKITAVFGDPVPPIFLKSDATGDGSGKTWKNACTNLSQAVAAAAAHTNRIFAAGGVYINAVTATDNRATVFDGFEIYGGFPGLSETEQISDRDIDRYPTIFTIDKGLDDTWHHYVPDPNSYTAPTAVDSGELVIRDGKINFPAYTAQYDVYLPTAARGNLGSSSVGITVPAKAHALIDGLWFHNAGQTVYLADTAKQSTIRNCRFIGGNSGNGVVFDRMGSSSEEGRIEGCRFYGFTNGGVWSFGHTTLINDAFESFYMPGVEHHAAIYFWTGGNHFVSDCTFARGLGYNSNRVGGYDGGAIFIGREQYDCAPVYRCVFTNSLLASTHTAGRSFLSIGGVSVTDCRFEHLRLLCKPTTDGTYALTQFDTWHDNWFVDFNRCVFAHNVVAAPATSLTGASYGLGIVGHTTGNFRYSLEDCTFVSNRFEHADAAGGNVVCADVLTRAAASGANSQIGLANCTFLEDGSAPVVAQYGTGHTKTLAIVNTIVSGPESAYQPFSFVNPGLVSILNGSIDAFAQLPDGLASTNGLQRDRVPLQAVAGPLGSTVYRPYARMPGLLDSCDVSTNSTSYLYQSYRYRAPGATTWTALTPTIAAVSQSTTFGPIPDAVQEPRFYGAFARGAVQTVADGTNGCVLVVRMEPLGAGRITATGLEDARAYAQTFPKGTVPAPITATGLRGATFLGWYTTNGVLLSANATYAPEALSDDTILVATFDPARVTITFAIKGGDARFETNLSDTVSLQCGIGTAFPSVPAYEYSTEDYIFEGWDKPFPVYVPAVDTAYTATLFTKSVRIIHVVPAAEMPAGSDGSGSSWANASTNFSAAYADAGHYRGEVWVKQGRYHVGNILPLPNVTLRGGFAGTETDAAQADPSAHKTVFSGDASENNYWNAGAKPKIWQDGVFTMPSIAWPPTGNNTDDIAYFFTAADNVTNCAVDGVTFTCFKSSVFQELSFSTDVSLSRCDLLANNTGAAGTVVLTKGLLALRDCRFIGSPSMVNFSGSSTGTNVIEDCLFAYSYHGNNGMIRNTATTRLDIRRTTFTHYRDYSWSSHHAAVLDYNNGSGTVEDCVFANHRCSTSSMGPVRIGQAGTAPLVEFIRCTFTNNVHDTGDNQSSHAACVRIINLSSCTFRDCRFAGNTTTVSTTDARYLASAVMVDAGYAQFINTTFEDNVVDAPAATTASSLACVRTTGTSSSAAFVNCAFRNNGTFVAINTPHADIGSYGTGTLGVFNTIFDAGGVISYLAIRENSSVPTMVASCVIDGPEPQFAAGGIYTNVWYGKAPLHDRLAEKDGYPAQLMVASSSPYARRGTPVWAAPNANLYRYYWYDAATDPAKPWRRTLVKSETAASVPGLSLASVPVPDAFGQIRRIRRTPIGPVNPEDSGTLLLLR
jgi:hypothetical protein